MIKKLSDSVIKWNRDISVLLKTQFDLLSATTLQEQNYWHNFVSSLRDLEQQLQSKEVTVYVDVLRKKNKFHITTSFDVESLHFKNMLQRATAISAFFKEIKI
jgi:chitinase